MSERARAAWVFALAAAAGLAGQTLLFAERQCWRLESALREDFRVVLFVRAPLEESRLKVLEEKLRAQPEVEELRYVSADDALGSLRREDPELAESVALVGDNPLPSAFELRPAADALPRLAAWLDGLRGLGEWSDLRYKAGELQAILRLRFYAHLLGAVLGGLFCLAAGLVLATLSATARGALKGHPPLTAAALAGGAAGILCAAALAWPLRRDELLWAWPPIAAQAALLAACGALGWTLSLWRAEH